MNIGELNKRIDIGKTKMTLINGMQKKVFDTSNAINTWASVNGVSSDVFWSDNNINSKDILNFVIRYRASIVKGMLVKYKGNLYEVEGIDDYKEEHIWLALRCREVIL